MADKPGNIDDYLANVSDEKKEALQELRVRIKQYVPEAVETIAYSMPAFRLNNRILIGFAAAKNHCSLYPWSAEAIEAHKDELADFSISAGTIRFQPGHPIPDDLLKKIIDFRRRQIEKA